MRFCDAAMPYRNFGAGRRRHRHNSCFHVAAPAQTKECSTCRIAIVKSIFLILDLRRSQDMYQKLHLAGRFHQKPVNHSGTIAKYLRRQNHGDKPGLVGIFQYLKPVATSKSPTTTARRWPSVISMSLLCADIQDWITLQTP
jgi:hypothetical protein